jgi:hypothetical protein
MANAGILITWEDSKLGREALGGELYMTSMAYYQAKVEDGTLESFEPFIAQRHGGDRNGFILLRGDRAKLDEMKRSDEFLAIMLKGIHCLTSFSVVDVFLGDGLNRVMGKWMELFASGS